MARFLLAVALATVIGVSAAAWGQQPVPVPRHAVPETAVRPVPALVAVGDVDAVVAPFGLTVGQLQGAALFGTDGREIGRIGSVMVTPQGRPAAVSVEVGSLFGSGRKEVIVRLESIRLRGNHLVAEMTRHEIEALPAWSG